MKFYRLSIFVISFIIFTSVSYANDSKSLICKINLDESCKISHSFFNNDNSICTLLTNSPGTNENDRSYELITFDLSTGERILSKKLGVLKNDEFVISKNNNFMAIFKDDIAIYDLISFKKCNTLKYKFVPIKKNCTKVFNFNYNNTCVAFTINEETIVIFDLENNKELYRYNVNDNFKCDYDITIKSDPKIYYLNFYPDTDANRILIGYTIDFEKEYEDGYTSRETYDELIILDYKKSKKYLVDKTYYVWPEFQNFKDQEHYGRFRNNNIIFLPKKKQIISDMGFHFIVYDFDGKFIKQCFSPEFKGLCGYYFGMDISNDEEEIYIGYGTKYLIIYETNNYTIKNKYYLGQPMYNTRLFEDQNMLLLGYNQYWIEDKYYGSDILYDLEKNKIINKWTTFTDYYCFNENIFLARTHQGNYEVWKYAKE